MTCRAVERGVLEVHGLTAEQVGDAAAAHGIAIHELTPQQASLEEAFMSLTRSELEFGARRRRAAARGWPREHARGPRRYSAARALRPGHAVARLRLGGHEAALGSLDAVGAARGLVFTIGFRGVAAAVVAHHWPHVSAPIEPTSTRSTSASSVCSSLSSRSVFSACW